MEGYTLFQGETIVKYYSINTLTTLKYHLLKNHFVNFNQTWNKAFLGGGDSKVQMKDLSFSKGK